MVFFVLKYFGSGVIIATAFMHVSTSSSGVAHEIENRADHVQLLQPGAEALGSVCLTGAISEYPWAFAIALMTIFAMFFLELMASRYGVYGLHAHDVEANDPSKNMLIDSEKHSNSSKNSVTSKWIGLVP